MDRDTIANHIQNLSKSKFDVLSRLILTRVFHMEVVDTDGKGDRGFDYRVLNDEGGSKAVAIQRTVQDQRWRAKAFEDAKKAADDGARRYFFMTSRQHESAAFRELEGKIAADLRIPATCLGAKELADLIDERDLQFEFADAIGLCMDFPPGQRIDAEEQMLHAYVALGTDRSSLREEVYDDTIAFVLHDPSQSKTREDIIAKASDLLGCPASRQELLHARFDSLLTRGVIQQSGNAAFTLSTSADKSIRVADGIYAAEINDLASAQSDLLHKKCGVTWTKEQARQAAVALSKWFISEQIEAAGRLSIPIAKGSLFKRLGDPEHDLEQLLLDAGTPRPQLGAILYEFVELARDQPITKKLTRGATFVALDGYDPLQSPKILGARSWSEVTVSLDASVAIPYMCATLFVPTEGRFSRGVNECLQLLRRMRAPICIPWFYINECASHLLRARDYDGASEAFARDLEYSQNAFVAHYFQLRNRGEAVPETLTGFLRQFSRAIVSQVPDRAFWTRRIMNDLQSLLGEYGVHYEDVERLHERFRRDVETSYVFKLSELHRSKSMQLVEHDVLMLAHQRRVIAERAEVRMTLTWDAAMIAVARELTDCGWVVSPSEAADLIQPNVKLSEARLCSLLHTLARVRERPSEAAARIVDRVVSFAGEHLKEWQFRERLQAFKDEALARIDVTDGKYADSIDQETDSFLRGEGITPTPAD